MAPVRGQRGAKPLALVNRTKTDRHCASSIIQLLQIVSYAKDGIILLKAMVMLSFHYGFSQSLFCNRIVVSSEIEASPILIVFLSPHQNLWFSRVCKYWQDKIRDTNRSKTNALCWPNQYEKIRRKILNTKHVSNVQNGSQPHLPSVSKLARFW